MGVRFGKLARDARLKAKVSMGDLALVLGLSRTYINDIETGNRNPPADRHLDLWAEKIGVKPSDFRKAAFNSRKRFFMDISLFSQTEKDFLLAFMEKRPKLEEALLTEFIEKMNDA